jgi:predicted ester cyclase/ketosteroid isomerase-like protein
MGLLMRTHPCLALLLVACAACSSESVAPPPKPPVGSLEAVPVRDAGAETVTAKERALPELYAKALSSSSGGAQFGELAPLLNVDLAGFSSPGMAPAHEPAAIVAAHEKMFGAFDDRKMTLSRVWRTPNQEVFEWTMTGTHAREWQGIAPTHKPVAFKGVTLLWTKDDGSITDVHVYFDVAVVKAQLGVGPKELLALPLPTAPTGSAQVIEQTPSGSAEEAKNVAVVKASLDALENSNEAGYVGAMADDVEVYGLESAAPVRGKGEAKAYYKAMHKAIGQLDTTVVSEWGFSGFAIVEYQVAGEQLGAIGWIPAQRDRVLRFELVDVCEIHDGKITRVWRYDNPGQIAQ